MGVPRTSDVNSLGSPMERQHAHGRDFDDYEVSQGRNRDTETGIMIGMIFCVCMEAVRCQVSCVVVIMKDPDISFECLADIMEELPEDLGSQFVLFPNGCP